MIPVSYNLRSLTVRARTTAATAGGLAVVVFLLGSVMMFSNGVVSTLSRSGSDDVAILLENGKSSEIESMFETARADAALDVVGIERGADGAPQATAEVVASINLPKTGTGGASSIQIRGTSDRSFAFRQHMKLVAGRQARMGTNEALVGRAVLGRFVGLNLNDSLSLPKNRSVTIVGVFEDGGSALESELWADVALVREAFGIEGMVSALRVRLSSAVQLDAFKASIEADPRLNLTTLRERKYYDQFAGGANLLIRMIAGILAVFFSMAAVLGATITMHATVSHRLREIGTLRALGFSKMSILSCFLLESTMLAFAGGVVGTVASFAMSFLEIPLVNPATGTEMMFKLEPTASIALSSLALAVVMGIVGGVFPAVRAAHVDALQALRD